MCMETKSEVHTIANSEKYFGLLNNSVSKYLFENITFTKNHLIN